MSSQARCQLIFQANFIQIPLAAESEKLARPKHKSLVLLPAVWGTPENTLSPCDFERPLQVFFHTLLFPPHPRIAIPPCTFKL